MASIVETWKDDHIHFDRLLDLLEAEIALFRHSQTPDYGLMLDIMYYMTHYPDVFHHPKEDLVFNRIADVDDGTRKEVRSLMEQHVVLRQSGTSLLEELQAVVDGAMLPRDRVEKAARAYIDYFRDHMEHEESRIFPLALELLDDADWAEIERLAPYQVDPVFASEAVARRYESLRRRIGTDARE